MLMKQKSRQMKIKQNLIKGGNMFTRKHFKAIAKIISNRSIVMSKKRLVDAFVSYFATINLQFDESKFRKACNVEK